MRWSSAISTEQALEHAVDRAAEDVKAGLGGARADLVVAFVTDHHATRSAVLGELIARHFPDAVLIGCSAGGAIAGTVEIEHEPALSLTVASLPGVTVTPFHAGDAPRRWGEEIRVPDPAPGERPAFLLLPCPLTCPVEVLLDWLDERWPGSVKVGGLASGGMTAVGPAGNSLFLGRERLGGGVVGVALAGDIHVDTVVAQGCKPIGEPMIVTKAIQNVAVELDGERPLAVLERLIDTLDHEERALARHSLFLGLAMRGSGPFRRGDFLIRNLAGIDPESGAIAAAAPLRPGQIVQFHLRDATTAATDLDEMLASYDASPPLGALLFSCIGRGQLLFGEPNFDSTTFARRVGELPVGGFFGNGEIGPVHGRTFMHGYTAAYAMFRRKLASA